MRPRLRNLLVLTALLCGGLRANTVLTLDPVGGALFGGPGQTVGWGFTLENTTDYLVVTSADYVTVTPLGVFTDFIAQFNFIVVGPAPESPTVIQAFDAGALTGIGSYQINAGAVPGALSTGFIQLTYDVYSVSPYDQGFDPGEDLVSTGNTLTADASVQVLEAAEVPEPATLALVALGLLAAGLAGRRLRGHPAAR